jgi:hypothetical protein
VRVQRDIRSICSVLSLSAAIATASTRTSTMLALDACESHFRRRKPKGKCNRAQNFFEERRGAPSMAIITKELFNHKSWIERAQVQTRVLACGRSKVVLLLSSTIEAAARTVGPDVTSITCRYGRICHDALGHCTRGLPTGCSPLLAVY